MPFGDPEFDDVSWNSERVVLRPFPRFRRAKERGPRLQILASRTDLYFCLSLAGRWPCELLISDSTPRQPLIRSRPDFDFGKGQSSRWSGASLDKAHRMISRGVSMCQRATVDPNHHGQRRVGNRGRAPHIECQTVFRFRQIIRLHARGPEGVCLQHPVPRLGGLRRSPAKIADRRRGVGIPLKLMTSPAATPEQVPIDLDE